MKKQYAPLLKSMREINPKGILIDSKFNSCIVGIGETYQGMVLIYNEDKIIKKLKETMPIEEALDFFDTAIIAESYGKYSPIFLIDLEE